MTLAERIDYYAMYVQNVENAISKAQRVSENGEEAKEEGKKG